MKKSAFLLATVAMLAMSASAFAAGIATADGIAKYDAAVVINNTFAIDTGNAATGKAFYCGATIPDLRIGVDLKADTTYTGGKYTATIGTNTPIDSDDTDAPENSLAPETFLIPAAQIAATGTTKIEFAVVDGSQQIQADRASLTITPTPIDIGFSADGYTAYLGEDTEAPTFTLDYDDTKLETLGDRLGYLSIGAISTGSSIMSEDVSGEDKAIKGLTVGFDRTGPSLYVMGAPEAEGEVKLALYFWANDGRSALVVTDGSETDAILATPVSADSDGDPMVYIIATFDLKVIAKPEPGDDKGGEAVTPSQEEVASAQTALDDIVPDSDITVRPSDKTDTVTKIDLQSVVESTGDFYRVTVVSAPLERSGDAIALGAKKISTRLPDESTANGISFVKVFDAANGAGVVPLDEVCGYNASTGLYELDATVVIIDDAAPATKPAGFVPGAKDGEGLAIVKTGAGNFVYIWDGNKDGIARDPIFARETNSSGSGGGACTAGFGLAAIAALASLAIRRRGK